MGSKHLSRRFLKVFKNKHGKIVLMQWPNRPLYVAGAAWIGTKISAGNWQTVFRIGFTLSLGYWAYLEITQGASTFRRFLGVCVLGFLLIGLAIKILN